MLKIASAALLPFAVPALITLALWAMPGDPTEILCPPGICTGADELAKRWGLDRGPLDFYLSWMGSAIQGSFGNSWRMAQGSPVSELLWESLPVTVALLALAALPLLVTSAFAAAGRHPAALERAFRAVGLLPAVVLALMAAAYVEIRHGALSHDGWPGLLRLLLGAAVLALADGALSDAVAGTRGVFEAERAQRYVAIATLRGEGVLGNTLPNVLPTLAGQARARLVGLMSGAVVVEVVLGIQGLGELLWAGTLLQDFGVVLAGAWAFSWLSALLLLSAALVDLGTTWWVRRVPAGTGA
jgi:peptide/nickel transport system permease protein